MKSIILLLVVLSVLSCTKDKEQNPLIGGWRLTQINSGDSSSIFLTGTELSVEFEADGHFNILGPKSNYTLLQDFNRYETLGNDRIRFLDTSSTQELYATFHLSKTLSLYYDLRCPYEEKFTRL